MTARSDRDDRGQVSVLVVGIAVVALATSGLAVDGGRAFIARRALQNAADGASLAGAAEVGRAGFYRSGGRSLALDPRRARSVASRWLSLRGLDATAAVESDGGTVRIVLRTEVPTTFLRLVGIARIPITVESLASPVPGPVP